MDASVTSLPNGQMPRGGRLPQFRREHMIEAADHQRARASPRRCDAARHRFPETDSLRDRCAAGSSVANQRRVLRGCDERRRGAEAVRLENLRHLGDRQPLGKRDADDVDVAAGDLVDDLERRHRPIEPVLAGLQLAALAAQVQRGPIGPDGRGSRRRRPADRRSHGCRRPAECRRTVRRPRNPRYGWCDAHGTATAPAPPATSDATSNAQQPDRTGFFIRSEPVRSR